MIDHSAPPHAAPDFRAPATFVACLVGMAVVVPFAVSGLLEGRLLLGGLALFIAAGLAWTARTARAGLWRPATSLFAVVLPVIAAQFLAVRSLGMVGALWCFPVILALYAILPERWAWFANGAVLAGVLPLATTAVEPGLVLRLGATLGTVSLFTAVFVRLIETQHRALERQAVTDPLTGLSNRTRLQDALERAIEQHRRTDTPMSLVAIDLDHFKAVNDAHGHDAGDAVLAAVGEHLRGRVRRIDEAFRTGGEEFLLLLFATAGDQAAELAEELRTAVADLELLPDRRVTLSAGVAELAAGEDWRAWMRHADDALYRAKDRGRDRVVL
jgi:diguanylate cyclase (GGDEF)-like protein